MAAEDGSRQRGRRMRHAPPKGKAAGAGAPSAASKLNYSHSSTEGTSVRNAPSAGLDALLDRLEGVRRTGPSTWVTRCPAHGDRRPSLSIRELNDGRVLVHCFAGCDTESVLAAVGLTFDALFSERAVAYHVPRERRPFPPMDVLRCVKSEALIVAVAAGNLANGLPLSDADRARLLVAAGRLQSAVEACHVA